MGESKTLALAISAIKNLREVRGSTSRDIVNYITKACQVDEDTVRKQVQASLKRGVAYGYLKRENGCYTFPLETEGAAREIAAQEIGLIEMCKRIKRGRKNVNKNRKSRRPNLCKRCGKTCPCANSSATNRRGKKFNNNRPIGAAGKTTRMNNVEELFGSRSFRDLKRRRKGNAVY